MSKEKLEEILKSIGSRQLRDLKNFILDSREYQKLCR